MALKFYSLHWNCENLKRDEDKEVIEVSFNFLELFEP